MTGSSIQLAHGSDDPCIDTEIVAGTGLRPFCQAAGERQHPARAAQLILDLDRTDQGLNDCYAASVSAMGTSGARSLPQQ
jgi:hypothetical protein